ncbi:hypothetical protein NKI98_14725 [Mesorhizobium sp. M0222]|uniref:hypothetical protein n=1 Tax=Mesorhizobium sp. M0222 TaxID=2956921 RepID=UPI00333723D4
MGTGSDYTPDFDIKRFKPAGPVCEAFINSNGPFDFIRGPWGSGKTVSAVFKIANKAGTLFPVCKDGKINVRCAAVRETYRELAKTALPTWLRFFPKHGPYTAKEKDAYSGGQDRPVNHILEWDVLRKWPDGWKETTVRLEMQFGAIGSENLESFFKGYEISFGWLNECDTMHEDVPGLLFGRTGRFPPRDTIMEWEGERLGYEVDPDTGNKVIKIPRMVFGDFNPPDEVNWTYKREIEEPEKWPGYNFFAQPSGLAANAENRDRKTRADYEAEERGFGGPKAADSIRNVHGKYAPKKVGTIIYDTFDLMVHRSNELLKPIPGLPISLGFDGGGRPALALGQFLPDGRLRALREIVSDPDVVTGATRFSTHCVELLLSDDFRGFPIVGAWGDPSDFEGADRIQGELAFMMTVSQAIGVMIMPTETNDIHSRTDALRWYFGMHDANTPRSIWDPRCKTSIRGFVSQYHLTKQASEGKTSLLEIDKNEYSHSINAWEYMAYGRRGRAAVIKDGAQAGRPTNVVPMKSITARSDFDVFKS